MKKRAKVKVEHKSVLFSVLDLVLLVLTIISVLLLFRNPFHFELDIIINISFLGLLLLQLLISENKNQFIRANIWDVIIICVISMPALRIFRIFRFIRFFRAGIFLRKINVKNIRKLLRLSKDNISLSSAVVFLVICAFAWLEYIAEHSINENFSSYKDALWWAMSTLSTVGYGDITPQTTLGRIIATALMIFGLLITGILISNLTAFLVEKD